MKINKINSKFKKNVVNSIKKGSSFVSPNEVEEFSRLLETIVFFQNQPKKRNGYKKTQVLASWLEKRGLEVNIIAVKNFDTNKTANKDGKWYLVEARIKGSEKSNSKINGLLLTHHDQVARKVEDFEVIQTDEKITYPWLLDDSVHVAASMIEMVNFKNWWEASKYKDQPAPNIRLVISDGEEMNTLGMRGLLDKWKKEKKLEPIDFMVVGESTNNFGSKSEVPGVAYTNSGKVLGVIKENNENIPVCHKVCDFFIRFRIAQKYLCIKSQISPHSKIPKVETSRLSSTIGSIGNVSELFWEVRTNTIYKTRESYGLLETIMSSDMSELIGYIRTINEYETRKKIRYNLDLNKTYQYVKIGDKEIIQIRTKRTYHPGAYNPFRQDDIFAALELLFFYMDKNELMEIEKVYFGDKDKPNTVGDSLYIELKHHIEIDSIIRRIRSNKSNLANTIHTLYQNYIKFAGRKVNWEIVQDKNVPPRDSVGEYEDNKWLVDIARSNLQKSILEATGKKVNVPLTVFNAMHDGGPTTYPEFKEKIWAKGENVIVLGTGDFSTLHNMESLSVKSFIYGMLAYKNLLQQLYLKVRR